MFLAKDLAEILNGTINQMYWAHFTGSVLVDPFWRRLDVAIIPRNSRTAERYATFLVPLDLDAEGYAACRRELWRRMEAGEDLHNITSWLGWLLRPANPLLGLYSPL
jgi:hypothetical protein